MSDFPAAKAARISLHHCVIRGAGLRCHDPSLDQSGDAVSSTGNRDSDIGDHAHCRAGALRTLLARRLVGGDVVRIREPELSIFCEQGIRAAEWKQAGLGYSEPRAADFSQAEYDADRRNADHRSRHRQKDLHGCADALESAVPRIEVTGNPPAERAANAACSIDGPESPADKIQQRWNGDDHENKRTDDSKVEFQITALEKQNPCGHHQAKCQAGEGGIDEWVKLV
jgi:hypothetical protein